MSAKLLKTMAASHTAGIFADMTLDGPEIGTLVAVIDRAKNLPNRKTMGKQDPYCAMRLGKEAKKTDTDRRGGQTPKWDQELRFTVHESPDYYKLKCSIFNDDKKTDLIGEAWIDLSDLVKPGGGSNDLWHQLNYKGKYAGEVRVELTYYDLRPREEKVLEKRKQREKAQSAASVTSSVASAPRQLGPREVRRRPLPTSPVGSSAVQPLAEPVVKNESPVPPPKIPLSRSEKPQVVSKPPVQDVQQHSFDPYTNNLSVVQAPVQQYHQPFCEDISPTAEYQEEPRWSPAIDQQRLEHHHQGSPSSMIPSPSSYQSPSWQDEVENQDQLSRPSSQRYSGLDSEHRHSLSLVPSPPAHSPDFSYNSSMTTTSPVKPIPYRDSPLRQSMSQQDVALQMVAEPDSYDLPPRPPMHRETPPRRPNPDYPPSSFPQNEKSLTFTPQSLNTSSRRKSVDDRSPLQQIEYQYDPHSRPTTTRRVSFERQGSRDSYHESQSYQPHMNSNEHQYTPDKRNSYDFYQSQGHSAPGPEHYVPDSPLERYSHEPAYQKPMYQDRSGSYDDQRLTNESINTTDHQAMVPHSNSQPNLPSANCYKPRPIHPQPQNSSPGHVPPRKAVSPGLRPQQDGQRLSQTPYGPDAYDVLNPASSHVTNEGTMYQTPAQAKEYARLREVEKIRDQAPIIGNDGRVIDPSDHLPSDTWAPEPERKQRRPEHIVHYRTKNDARSHRTPNSSPASARFNHQQPSVQSSPSSAPPSSGRNRLHKPPPSRPLPVQPYQQTSPEPAFNYRAEQGQMVEPSTQRSLPQFRPEHATPPTHRPHLSEYQVPSSNNYTPRGSSYHDGYSPAPSKPHMQTGRDHQPRNSSHYEDAFAAEMSTIDIGPSRGGQMVLSGRRGY